MRTVSQCQQEKMVDRTHQSVDTQIVVRMYDGHSHLLFTHGEYKEYVSSNSQESWFYTH